MTTHQPPSVSLEFDMGTITLRPPRPELEELIETHLVPDPRVQALRTEACHYRKVIEALVDRDVPYQDEARGYDRLESLTAREAFRPYPHQDEALQAWLDGGRAGVVVMPTGSGKTYLAQMIMAECRRSTLIVVPTLDLVSQWVGSLEQCFGGPVGIVGGGDFNVQPITVITYDSAARHMEHLGNRFGLLVFDECHHLPGEVYSDIARMSLAPFRLGLTATPERSDGGEVLLAGLVGPTLYTTRVSALAGDILAPYDTVRLEVDLTAPEREAYTTARETYLGFCRRHRIRFSAAGGWHDFLKQTARSKDGRRAFDAYRLQRHIPLTCEEKFQALADLLWKHREDRTIIFTHVNELAYAISRQYLIPVITHQTPPRERADILARFGTGDYPAVVTSKVLNEGVDVPEANIAVILSGSGSIREHVQRLGRILRRGPNKQATLYEIVARDTNEQSMSDRRTRHEAYRGRGRKGRAR